VYATGSIREVVVRLSFLDQLYRQPGPFVSVYLDTSRDTEDAQQEIDLRWREARQQLAADGAPAADLEAIEKIAPTLRGRGHTGHAIFATAGAVIYAAELDGPPRRQTARFSPLPHTMPLVAQTRETVPHVLVVVDRIGADITAVGRGGEQLDREVEGKTYPIHKVSQGGWSEKRIQQRVENTWEENAGLVARSVTEAAQVCGAEVVLVAGEDRARSELQRAFGPDLQADVIEVSGGGRAAGIDHEHFTVEVDKLLSDRVAVRVALHAAKFREELGQRDRAAEGLAASVDALRLGQAETLLVNDDPTADGSLFVGPEPKHLALTHDELRGLGVEKPLEDRADAALVRASAGTDAELIVVAKEELALRDGVGALLRYTYAGDARSR
jgi:hypothetical protein